MIVGKLEFYHVIFHLPEPIIIFVVPLRYSVSHKSNPSIRDFGYNDNTSGASEFTIPIPVNDCAYDEGLLDFSNDLGVVSKGAVIPKYQ